MNLAALAAAAFRRAPASTRGAVTFTDADGYTTEGTYTAVSSARGTTGSMDDLKAGAVVAQKARHMTVLPDGLTFVPKAGDTAVFADATWQVLGCTPVNPGGDALIYYRVTVAR